MFAPVAMKDSLDILLKLAGAGVYDRGVTVQGHSLGKHLPVTFHTEPMACLLRSDILQLLSA